MDRKVIRQGNDTLTITLPRDWTRKFDIKSGDSLNVSTKDYILELSGKRAVHAEKYKIVIEKNDCNLVRWCIGALFRIGADEVELEYNDEATLNTIQVVLTNKFAGFIITDQKRGCCIIKSLSSDDEKNLQSLMNRSFLIVISFADNCLLYLKDRDFKKMRDIIYLHDNCDQTIALCERIINKNCYGGIINASARFSIIENLELMGDLYRNLALLFASMEKPFKEHDVLAGILGDANNCFRSAYELMHEYNDAKIIRDVEAISKTRKRVTGLYPKYGGKELLFLFNITSLLELARNFYKSIIMMHIAARYSDAKLS